MDLLALYRGAALADLQLVAVSTDPEIVSELAERLLAQPPHPDNDAALASVDAGKRRALRHLVDEHAARRGGRR